MEDYATDSLSDGELEEAKQIYTDSIERLAECKTAVENAVGKEKKKLQSEIEALEIVVDERERFNQPKMAAKVKKAQELLSHSVEELYGISEPTMDKYNEANALPENTKEQAQLKLARLKEASRELDLFHKKAYDYIQARKLMKQVEYYSHWDEMFSLQTV